MSTSTESVASVKSGGGSPSTTGKRSSVRRAVGVVRVRGWATVTAKVVPPRERAERIQSVAARDGLALVDTLEEPNVSAGAPLDKAPRPEPRRRDGGGCRLGTPYLDVLLNEDDGNDDMDEE